MSSLLLVSLGLGLAQDFDCSDGQDAWLSELEATGSRRAYTCLAADETAAKALIARAAEPEPGTRVTRALAVWRLHRLDGEVGAEEARTYNPADRRLLLDGIKAHRGRATPAPDHLKVLEAMPWYAPNDRYTDARLTPQDRQNMVLITTPPAPEPSPAAPEVSAPAAEVATEGRCGCATGQSPALGWMLWLGLGLSWLRRAGPGASARPRRAAPLRQG